MSVSVTPQAVRLAMKSGVCILAALAPVRVPAGRQGGPRTNYAAGWSQEAADKQNQSLRVKDRPKRPVLLVAGPGEA
jgi:hypothetical protein